MKPTLEQITKFQECYAQSPGGHVEGLCAVVEYYESIRPKDQAAPEPLAFPDPPYGWEWHNPENLTPEQVGIRDGWRLIVTGEDREMGCLYELDVESANKFGCAPGWMEITHRDPFLAGWTYRTKAPLPAPKPTPEEIERAEIIAAWEKIDGDWELESFESGWKAAKKGAAQ